MLFVQNEGKGSGDCVEGLAAGLSGGFLPDAPDSFLVYFFLPVVFLSLIHISLYRFHAVPVAGGKEVLENIFFHVQENSCQSAAAVHNLSLIHI